MGADAVDAIVVGAGPNGLAAAITLARAGRSVRVLEARPTPGGGARTAELTLPGYRHDVCSAFHPLAVSSPFFRSLDLAGHGVDLVHPPLPLAHPLDGDRAAVLDRSIERTAALLGADGDRWRQLIGWAADRWDRLAPSLLQPFAGFPSRPLDLARFGLRAAWPATVAARAFRGIEAKALFAGLVGHSFLPLSHPFTSSFGLVLGAAAHAGGWPLVAGGSQRLVDAMVSELTAVGGTVECDRPVRSVADLDTGRTVLFDLGPRQVARLASVALAPAEVRRMRRYRLGPGVFKLDYALSEPIPWASRRCAEAGTVHVGGTFDEVAAAEAEVCSGRHPRAPFVLAGQQSRFDTTRAPGDHHTLWAYCHVPNGSTVDMTDAIERQLERFAPGFRDTIIARHRAGPAWFENHNENNTGGDIAGGSYAGTRLLLRPGWRLHPYRTTNPRLFLCSGSTPPGAGVHGMCGHNAALDVLRTALA
jgi:phytoene dehydrogenase-like protein